MVLIDNSTERQSLSNKYIKFRDEIALSASDRQRPHYGMLDI